MHRTSYHAATTHWQQPRLRDPHPAVVPLCVHQYVSVSVETWHTVRASTYATAGSAYLVIHARSCTDACHIHHPEPRIGSEESVPIYQLPPAVDACAW